MHDAPSPDRPPTRTLSGIGKPTEIGLWVDPALDRVAVADMQSGSGTATTGTGAARPDAAGLADLLRLWRDRARGFLVDPRELSAETLRPWLPRLLICRKLPGPLVFETTLCGADLQGVIGRDPRGAPIHEMISRREVPRDLYSGLQNCIDRRCPVFQTIAPTPAGAPDSRPDTARPPVAALHLPIGRHHASQSHVMMLITGLDAAGAGTGDPMMAAALAAIGGRGQDDTIQDRHAA